jgi:hypothetical protein
LQEDVGGLAVEYQLREEHEEYPGSLMSMERYDPEIHEDIHRSQGPPFTRGVETVGHYYRTICSLGHRLKDRDQIGITKTFPTQCHLNGEVLSV